MESLLSLFRMHWDPEPVDRAVASWSAPVLWRFRPASIAKAPEDWGQNLVGPPTVHGKPRRHSGVHWDHEPDLHKSLNDE